MESIGAGIGAELCLANDGGTTAIPFSAGTGGSVIFIFSIGDDDRSTPSAFKL